jgi:pimeloyl-ACP methyl ester carboxylesterase
VSAVPDPGFGRAARFLLTATVALALVALLVATWRAGRLAWRPPAPRPTLVLVHGLGGGPGDWLDLANRFGRDHRVVLVRLPGHAHLAMVDTLPLEAAARDLAGTIRDAYSGFARDSAQAGELVREAGVLEPRSFRLRLDEAAGADLSGDAARVGVPVLAVLSERSWPQEEPWAAAAESLGYARLSRVTAVRVDSCGHFVTLDRPAELERRIREWERGCP